MASKSNVLKLFEFNPFENQQPYKEIAVVRGSWGEMGKQYVQQCKCGYMVVCADIYANVTRALGGKKKAFDAARRYILAARKDFPQLVELLQGMADEAGFELEYAVMAFYGISMLRAERECSEVAAWGRATKDGHLLGAANVDVGYDADALLPAVLAYPQDGNAFISLGMFHRTGLNSKGLLSQMTGAQNAGKKGMISPTRKHPRHMWNDANLYALAFAGSTQEALEKFEEWDFICGCNQLYGDASHDVRLIEFNASKAGVRKAGDLGEVDYLLENNGSHHPQMQSTLVAGPGYWEDVLPRYWSVEQHVKDNLGEITPDVLFAAESLMRFYVPQGWSFALDDEWGVRRWTNDDREPCPTGWHEPQNRMQCGWSPQIHQPDFGPSMRSLIDADERTVSLMKGSSKPWYSKMPSLGTFWTIKLLDSPEEVIDFARRESEMQIWIGARDIDDLGGNREREAWLTAAKDLHYQGIKLESLALCAEAEESSAEAISLFLGQSVSAYCAAQCYARKAQDAPALFAQGRG